MEQNRPCYFTSFSGEKKYRAKSKAPTQYYTVIGLRAMRYAATSPSTHTHIPVKAVTENTVSA